MKAAVLHAPRDLRVEATREPSVRSGEVLVRVRAAGVCGTDYRIWSGERPVRYPLVMGHEFIGEAAAVGEGVTRIRPGERLAIEPNYSCGVCDLCREGQSNLCLRRTAIGIDVAGGFAELAAVPERCCWPAPDAIAEEQLLLVEPLAVVVRAVGRGAPRSGESAAVLGVGTLGLLALQVLRARGCRVLVLSRSERRLALARELGAEAAAPLGADAGVGAARAFAGRDGVDLLVETAGTPEAVEVALGLARPGGRVVLTGLPHAPSSVNFFRVVRRELQILGSMIYQREFGEALDLLAEGRVRTAPLITHRFPLEAIADALETHRRPEAIKVAVFP
ncbi:MAG: alcohol dehydrogenase catalytic domain-containing protein [Candidatus Rokubacteria bacterium]|nr:alcohol dehydrogenase catalytic domain-containing protein [Candidatus Rokubacteria bacterium]